MSCAGSSASSSSSSSTSPTSIKIDAFCPVGIGGTKGIDTTYLKLFVGGLSPQYSSKDLFDLFSKFGTIRESVVIPDRFRVRSRCYGFVTFSSEKSAKTALGSLPIVAENGAELTVVLASTNTKPRRAHFNVKHGISGHKPLPTVNEEEEEQESVSVYGGSDGPKYIRKDSKKNAKSASPGGHKRGKSSGAAPAKDGSNSKVGIYTDPSLFRTANIQQIAPAQFHVDNKSKKKKKGSNPGAWPNEDIKKDYQDLKKVTVSNDNRFSDKKAWKLIASEQEPEKESYYGSSYYSSGPNCYDDAAEDDDDICSIKSREWTPIAPKTHSQTSKKSGASKRRHKRRIGGSKKSSAFKRRPYHWNGTSTNVEDSDSVTKYWQDSAPQQAEDDEDDRITVSSSVFNAIFDEDMSLNDKQTPNDVRMTEPDKASQLELQRTTGKVTPAVSTVPLAACSVSSSSCQPINAMWGAYEPVFSMTNIHDYNFQNMAPTPPILPITPHTVPSVKGMVLNSECASYAPLSAMNSAMMIPNTTGSANYYVPRNDVNYVNCYVQHPQQQQQQQQPPSQSGAVMNGGQMAAYTGLTASMVNCNNSASVTMGQPNVCYNTSYLYNPSVPSMSSSK